MQRQRKAVAKTGGIDASRKAKSDPILLSTFSIYNYKCKGISGLIIIIIKVINYLGERPKTKRTFSYSWLLLLVCILYLYWLLVSILSFFISARPGVNPYGILKKMSESVVCVLCVSFVVCVGIRHSYSYQYHNS